MADANALYGLIQDLNALYDALPDGEGHADHRVQARYNALVERAQAVTGADFREFRIDDELVVSLGALPGIGDDPEHAGGVLELRSLRPLLAGLIGELEAYDPRSRKHQD